MRKAPLLSRKLQPQSLCPSDVRLERVMPLLPVRFLLRIAGAHCQTWKELRALLMTPVAQTRRHLPAHFLETCEAPLCSAGNARPASRGALITPPAAITAGAATTLRADIWKGWSAGGGDDTGGATWCPLPAHFLVMRGVLLLSLGLLPQNLCCSAARLEQVTRLLPVRVLLRTAGAHGRPGHLLATHGGHPLSH